MTFEQFDKTGWTGNMKCIFQDEEYGIATVDFEERLVGIYVKNNRFFAKHLL